MDQSTKAIENKGFQQLGSLGGELTLEQLVIAIKSANGSKETAEALQQHLWQRIEPCLRRQVSLMIRDYPDDIDDLLVQIKDKIRDKTCQFEKKAGATFKSWAYVVAKHEVFNWIRNRNRLVQMSEMNEVEIDSVFGLVPSPEEEFINNETRTIIREAIKTLPNLEQEVIRKMDYLGLSVREVAVELNISESNVKIQHFRAKKRLGQILKFQKLFESLRS